MNFFVILLDKKIGPMKKEISNFMKCQVFSETDIFMKIYTRAHRPLKRFLERPKRMFSLKHCLFKDKFNVYRYEMKEFINEFSQ